MKSDNKEKIRTYLTVAGIAVSIYALGYYKGRSQALSRAIILCMN